jgi:hypothetical protein
MDCPQAEKWLSEYIESSLASADMDRVAKHLESCPHCSALLEDMRSGIALCQSYPVLEMTPDLIEQILLRTSGRPRTRSFQEIFKQRFLRPLLTPRFAVGVSLATLFLVMLIHFMLPRVPLALSALSPSGIFGVMDRGVQKLYGEGLKAYEKKNEWQAQLIFFKNNIFNKLNYLIEQFETPIEGTNQPEEPWRQRKKAPGNKSSSLFSLPA